MDSANPAGCVTATGFQSCNRGVYAADAWSGRAPNPPLHFSNHVQARGPVAIASDSDHWKVEVSIVNLDEIKGCIPHREPFLWLDEVTEITDQYLVATKYLSPDLPVFQGHYPGLPIFPGVLQCEACFQASAVLISRLAKPGGGEVPVVTRLNNTQFRRMIHPGQTIEIRVDLAERLANAFYLKGKVTLDGKVTSRLEFVCTMANVGAEGGE